MANWQHRKSDETKRRRENPEIERACAMRRKMRKRVGADLLESLNGEAHAHDGLQPGEDGEHGDVLLQVVVGRRLVGRQTVHKLTP
jgi:hypothetical protein